MPGKIDAVVIELDREYPYMDYQVTYLQKEGRFKNPVYYGKDCAGDFSYEGFEPISAASFIHRDNFESEKGFFPQSAAIDRYGIPQNPEMAVVNCFMINEIFNQKIFPDQRNIYGLKQPSETKEILGSHLVSLMHDTGIELGDDVRKNIRTAVLDLNDRDMEAIGFRRLQNNGYIA